MPFLNVAGLLKYSNITHTVREEPAFSVSIAMHPNHDAFVSTNTRCWPCPLWLTNGIKALFWCIAGVLRGRVQSDRWLRYERDLATANPPAADINLTPLTKELLDRLQENYPAQRIWLESADRFWRLGLRSCYIWLSDGEPLCMQWLFTNDDNVKLRSLPQWSGMYLPLESHWGQAENIVTFPKGIRRAGGAATDFEYAFFSVAQNIGLQHLISHVHVRNIAAHRFAQRTGWQQCGTIDRYSIDVRGLRGWYLHLHQLRRPHSDDPHVQGAGHDIERP